MHHVHQNSHFHCFLIKLEVKWGFIPVASHEFPAKIFCLSCPGLSLHSIKCSLVSLLVAWVTAPVTNSHYFCVLEMTGHCDCSWSLKYLTTNGKHPSTVPLYFPIVISLIETSFPEHLRDNGFPISAHLMLNKSSKSWVYLQCFCRSLRL